MNKWLKKSLDLASKGNYYDQLHSVYKIATEENKGRDIKEETWANVEKYFNDKDDINLIKSIFALKKWDVKKEKWVSNGGKFPFKTSYIRYFYRAQSSDKEFFNRNPKTVKIISDRLYKLGLNGIKDGVSAGAETNQQQGPAFLNFLKSIDFENYHIEKLEYDSFKSSDSNAILIASDSIIGKFAREHCGYTGEKGLDFVARINKKYIIGEAKFISDNGGNQDKSLLDARNTLSNSDSDVIFILDGVCFNKSKNNLFKTVSVELKDENILSALFLKEFIISKLHEA